MGRSEASLNNAKLYTLCMSPSLPFAGPISEGFFFYTLTRNHTLCQIKFQQSVN